MRKISFFIKDIVFIKKQFLKFFEPNDINLIIVKSPSIKTEIIKSHQSKSIQPLINKAQTFYAINNTKKLFPPTEPSRSKIVDLEKFNYKEKLMVKS